MQCHVLSAVQSCVKTATLGPVYSGPSLYREVARINTVQGRSQAIRWCMPYSYWGLQHHAKQKAQTKLY